MDPIRHASLGQLRRVFIGQVAATAPEVFQALEDLLPVAEAAWSRRYPADSPQHPPLPPEAAPLPEIAAWARSFNLDPSDGSWLVRAATFTLHWWRVSGVRSFWLAPPPYNQPVPQPFRFRFVTKNDQEWEVVDGKRVVPSVSPLYPWEIPGKPKPWFPNAEKWSAYARATRRQLKKKLSEALTLYKTTTESRWRRFGWKAPPEKRGDAVNRHMKWLVQYQVGGLSFADVAREEPEALGDEFDPDSKRRMIETEVKKAATDIGLSLRPARRGLARAHSASQGSFPSRASARRSSSARLPRPRPRRKE